jgi:hypothetical protein
VRLSDLLGSEVVATDGRKFGQVEDVRLVQDGPLLLPFGAALRVDRLVVGTRRVGTRLGYNRGGLRGPALLRTLFGVTERRTHNVPWEAVREWDGRTVLVDADLLASEVAAGSYD